MINDTRLNTLGIRREEVGVILVDHGSRRDESNALLDEVANAFAKHSGWAIVEPAHMELAEPSIETAFNFAVSKGAKLVIVFPYFLGPGRHWKHDIPRLAGDAASKHSDVKFIVTAPLGVHSLMNVIIADRITNCLSRAVAKSDPCEVCRNDGGCELRESIRTNASAT